MRIEKLEVDNILGLGTVSLDFAESAFVALVGRNGSGKSSIFDSVVIALFGEPSESRPIPVSGIPGKDGKDGWVRLSFLAGTDANAGTYVVTRTFKRNKRGAVSHEAVLERLHANGETSLCAEGAVNVSEAVATLVSPWKTDGPLYGKTDGKAFVKKVRDVFLVSQFLSQGKATAILDASPSERWAVLSAVFGIGDGEILKNVSKETVALAQKRRDDIASRMKTLENTLSRMPEIHEMEASRTTALSELDRMNSEIAEIERMTAVLAKREEIVSSTAKLAESIGSGQSDLRKISGRISLEGSADILRKIRASAKELVALMKSKTERESVFSQLVKSESVMGSVLEQLTVRESSLGKEISEISLLASSAPGIERLLSLEESFLAGKKTLSMAESEISELEKRIENGKRIVSFVRGTNAEKRLSEALEVRSKLLANARSGEKQIAESVRRLLGLLANDKGMIDINALDAGDCESLVKNIRDSGLSKDVETLSVAKSELKRTDDVIEAQRKEIETIGAFDRGVDPKHLRSDPEFLEKALSGLIDSKNVLDGKRLGAKQNVDSLGKSITDFMEKNPGLPASCDEREKSISAWKKVQSLRTELDSARQEIFKKRSTLSNIREEMNSSTAKIGEITEKIGTAKNAMSDMFSGWKSGIVGADVGKIREIVAVSRMAPSDPKQLLEKERSIRAKIDADEILLSGMKRELSETEKDFAGILKKGLSGSADGNRMKTELLRNVSDVQRQIGSISANLDVRKKTELDLKAGTKQLSESDSALGLSKQFATLTGGREFPHFVMDRAFERILGPVNDALASYGKAFTLRAEDGKILADENGMVRSAESLSGGERILATMAILGQIQKMTGFEGTLFIDEGLAMLDTESVDEVLDTLSENSAKSFIGIITHDHDVAGRFPEVWTVSNGCVEVCGRNGTESEVDVVENRSM